MVELNSSRRKARTILSYINKVLAEDSDNSKLRNYLKTKDSLLSINELPLSLKVKINKNANAIWKYLPEITDILEELCEKESMDQTLKNFEQHQGKGQGGAGSSAEEVSDNSTEADEDDMSSEENNSESSMAGNNSMNKTDLSSVDFKELLDSLTDMLDKSVEDEMKNPVPEELKDTVNSLMDKIGKDNIDFIEENEGLIEDTVKALAEALSSENEAVQNDKLDKFKASLQECKDVKDSLQPFASALGESTDTIFKSKGFVELSKYAALLEKRKDIQALARMLGRQEENKKEKLKEMRDSIQKIETSQQIQHAKFGNMAGVTYSNDITRATISELALLADSSTENLFYKKYAEKQLLSYEYIQKIKKDSDEHIKQNRGSIIMAIDTSGSMSGVVKEAKLLAFAITKIALKEKRKCFLVMFSDKVETLNLSSFKGETGIHRLIDFLTSDFTGGTDFEPCIEEVLRRLEDENFKNADVEVISDFEMKDLKKETMQGIRNACENGNRFFYYVMGNNPNRKITGDYVIKYDSVSDTWIHPESN